MLLNIAVVSGRAITFGALAVTCLSAVVVVLAATKWFASKPRRNTTSAQDDRKKYALLCAVGLAIFAVSLAMALRAHQRPYGFRGPALADFSSLEPIDAHTHIFHTGPAFVAMLTRLHMHVLNIMYVDDTDPYRPTTHPQEEDALNFIASSKGRAKLCTTFDPFRFNDPDFAAPAIRSLNKDFDQGAIAAKIWKNIGMEVKDKSGRYILPDDPGLEPIYRDIAARDKTLIVHAAEPDAAWESSRNPANPNAKYYIDHPQWDMSTKKTAPDKNTILQARDHLLAMNPNLRVIGAHFGSLEDHLDDLAARLDQHPNFAVDTAARMPALVAQPRSRVRDFLLKYQDRILYGTDREFYAANKGQTAAELWEAQYARDWRYLATNDKFKYLGHDVQGLDLPRSVLKKIYHDNAVHWIPGILGTQQNAASQLNSSTQRRAFHLRGSS
ncbi:MAG TPA: amidohydrolase [Acidisarcina sp.]